MTEADLIRSVKLGDESAMETLFRNHIEYAVHLAYLITRCSMLAEDVAQDSFIKAFRFIKGFDESKPFKPWLTKIIVNTGKTALKASSKYVPASVMEDAVTDTGINPEEAVVKKERHRLLLDEINSLSDKYRIPLLLKYYSELSEKEIASVLKMPQSTVKSRLYIARQRLRQKLENLAGKKGDL